MRKEAILALVGFLVGAATLAGGDDEGELRDELERLQREAARAMQRKWEATGGAPSDGGGNQLGFFPIEDLAQPRYDFIPPTHDFDLENSEAPVFGGQTEEGTLPFGTGEELMELIRVSVDPESWESSILNLTGRNLIVLARPATIGKVRAFLDRTLRPQAHRGVAMDLDVIELPHAMLRKLQRTANPGLDDAMRRELEAAVASGTAHRVFGLRGAGTLGTRFVVWHGRQVAVVPDFDVEVAQTASTADPSVSIVQAGGSLTTIANLGQDGSIALDLGLRLEELHGIRRHETRRSGVLDLPDRTEHIARVSLRVADGQWAVAGSGTPKPGRHRVYLVRASLLQTGGAR